ncbi:hypothetical protein EOD41_15495 [Mucilaginibacter limnophilus]|uniref:Lipocalin-like domain-containing protein n=1 Tax=Mucilaginibacter limnophilus TaxID=1932778 RepID=A0A437MQC3_9SPHI|nr:hypothetical protein [Mucilaginibacter limnophilus]RVT99843.1 hypothetical protein EOD41_15495 [Mucilaginibacter limnophilus]
MKASNKIILFSGIIGTVFMLGCKSKVQPEKLYGKWNYIRAYSPNANPPDSVSNTELQELKPYIEFTRPDKLRIIWDGKVLSQGTFTLDGDNIRYKEIFADGQSRQFPFYVSELTDKQIIFETVGKDGSKVTAVKDGSR